MNSENMQFEFLLYTVFNKFTFEFPYVDTQFCAHFSIVKTKTGSLEQVQFGGALLSSCDDYFAMNFLILGSGTILTVSADTLFNLQSYSASIHIILCLSADRGRLGGPFHICQDAYVQVLECSIWLM